MGGGAEEQHPDYAKHGEVVGVDTQDPVCPCHSPTKFGRTDSTAAAGVLALLRSRLDAFLLIGLAFGLPLGTIDDFSWGDSLS
jgi:hypothetical protein